MSAPLKMAVFVSGVGRNLRALIDSCGSGELASLASVAVVVSSRSQAPALEIAKKNGIDTFLYTKDIDCSRLLAELRGRGIELIALAGYLKLVEPELVREFSGRIVNIHPALLPKYGGKGMYGLHVHRAALDSGDRESGATVHLVDERYDTGRILAQEKVCVLSEDTPEALEERIIEVEKKLYPRTLAEYITNSLQVDENRSR
ncbi:MAG: phosphoribosylglycinamide formyltransferase [Candidatus Zixiibacteriota bacterium]